MPESLLESIIMSMTDMPAPWALIAISVLLFVYYILRYLTSHNKHYMVYAFFTVILIASMAMYITTAEQTGKDQQLFKPVNTGTQPVTMLIDIQTPTTTAPTTQPTPVITPNTVPSVIDIKIKSSTYIPNEFKTVTGVTIRWTNHDSSTYMINIDGVQSPLLNKGDTWEHTLNLPGVYEYSDQLHPTMEHGKITVN